MDFRPPIGWSDFQKLRQRGATYIDKTAFVGEVMANWSEVLLLPRPRRFGKTLNLSTLRYFLEKSDEDRAPLFEGLAVWEDAAARAHFGRYPVIDLTFKDVKGGTWEETFNGIRELLGRMCGRHREALEGVDPTTRVVLDRIVHLEAEPSDCWGLLQWLSESLAHHHGAPVVILIDEYDAPIHSAVTRGFYDEAILFFRNFLSAGFKDNPHLAKGVVTGILRVAKANIFSGLNNVDVRTLLDADFDAAFGFTEQEVRSLAEKADAVEHLETIHRWYNGYTFGNERVYNPWSVLKFLSSASKQPAAYWLGTSSNELLRDVLLRGGLNDPEAVSALLRGETVRQRVEDSIVLRDVYDNPGAAWGLLLFSGYLTATAVEISGDITVDLAIPNREVATIFRDVFARWLRERLGGPSSVQAMLDALLAGDADIFEHFLGGLLRDSMSFHDFAHRTPERIYHAFIAGLLLALEPDYEVRSNREAAYGRYDLMVSPREAGRPGAVLELKVPRRNETLEHALDAAVTQLRERDYAAELRARGATPVSELAVVFDGKEVRVARAR